MLKTVIVLLVVTAAVASAAIRVPEPSIAAEIGTATAGVAFLAWRIFRKNR